MTSFSTFRKREVFFLAPHQQHDQHQRHQPREHLQIAFQPESMFGQVDGASALPAHHSHSVVALNDIHLSTSKPPPLIATRSNLAPEVVLGVLDGTPTSVAIGHTAS